jgi:cytochrome c peroxidase
VRKTPSFINAGLTFVPNRFGWDGGAASLEEQSLRPIVNPAEMGQHSLATGAHPHRDLRLREVLSAGVR